MNSDEFVTLLNKFVYLEGEVRSIGTRVDALEVQARSLRARINKVKFGDDEIETNKYSDGFDFLRKGLQ